MNKFNTVIPLVISVLLFNAPSVIAEQRLAFETKQDLRQTKKQLNNNIRKVRTPHKASAARNRVYRNVRVTRYYGNIYPGYGFYHADNDAFKWLAFTSISLKILDNINEDAQRKHEAAQVKATTANVGEKIVWNTTQSSGYVVTTKEGTNNVGLTCREFQQSIKVGGKIETAYGSACLQADGAWKIVG
ncbi:MAG: RT0821/Lpp0805 family surface protein [Oceanospirillaceae bacterium]